MQISTFARYGLRAIIRLAHITTSEKKLASIKEIAELEKISPKYLEAIFSALKRNLFIASTKGKYGGYSLTKPASQITVLEIIEVLDGSVAPLDCIIDSKKCVNHTDNCFVGDLWHDLYLVIKNFLGSKTLQDIIDEGKII